MREQVCQHAVPRFADLGQIVAIARPQGLRHGIVPGWSGNNFQAGLGDEFYWMAGDVDYMLRVVIPDMQSYDVFYKKLINAVPLKNVTSRFAMEKIKSITALPIPLVVAD